MTVFNSTGHLECIEVRDPAYIEGCEFGDAAPEVKCRLARNNVVVGWHPAVSGNNVFDLGLSFGVGLVVLPVRLPAGEAHFENSAEGARNVTDVPVLFGIDDDNKGTVGSGNCRYLDEPLQKLLDAGVFETMLWPCDAAAAGSENATSQEKSVWTAKLWLAGEDR